MPAYDHPLTKYETIVKLPNPLGRFYFQDQVIPQLTFTCSKSSLETLEKGVKYIQS